MTPQMVSRKDYNVWLQPDGEHVVIYVRVGTVDGFDSLVLQLKTENDILKIYVEDRQVAETDGEKVNYGR
jgi:uncharacterized protein with ACT and thioredoxin-like domain